MFTVANILRSSTNWALPAAFVSGGVIYSAIQAIRVKRNQADLEYIQGRLEEDRDRLVSPSGTLEQIPLYREEHFEGRAMRELLSHLKTQAEEPIVDDQSLISPIKTAVTTFLSDYKTSAESGRVRAAQDFYHGMAEHKRPVQAWALNEVEKTTQELNKSLSNIATAQQALILLSQFRQLLSTSMDNHATLRQWVAPSADRDYLARIDTDSVYSVENQVNAWVKDHPSDYDLKRALIPLVVGLAAAVLIHHLPRLKVVISP